MALLKKKAVAESVGKQSKAEPKVEVSAEPVGKQPPAPPVASEKEKALHRLLAELTAGLKELDALLERVPWHKLRQKVQEKIRKLIALIQP